MGIGKTETFRNLSRRTIMLLVSMILLLGGGCVSVQKRGDHPVVQEGIASWYGKKFHGRITASGERYDMNKMTAAHPFLPFGSRVKVTHLGNKRVVIVRINDRGPFVSGRIIDLSRKAARKLGMIDEGVARVLVQVLD